MRIQKYLSRQGILSRRKAEDYIRQGLVLVNGKVVTKLGTKINPMKDKVTLAINTKEIKKNYIYLAYYKPIGVVSCLAQNDEKEIKDLLPMKYKKLSPIGRLDKDSEGLILLTNDGIFAKNLLQNVKPHEREYVVWINSFLTFQKKQHLEAGIVIDGKKTKPAVIHMINNTCFRIILKEGRNRQIRKMVQKAGSQVVKLKRIRFANINLGNLKIGEFRELSLEEVESFK